MLFNLMNNHNKILWLCGGKCKEEVEILLLHSGMTISLARDMTFFRIIYILIPGPVNTG